MFQVTITVDGTLRFAQVCASSEEAHAVEYRNAVRLEGEFQGAVVKGRVRKA